MELKRNRLNLKFIFIAILLGLLLLAGSLCCVPTVPICADATQYTSVLDDLKKDETFNIAMYPTNREDYSLQVIQIAESVDGELFVYVYQPSRGSKDSFAVSINISTSLHENLHYENYGLLLINCYTTLFKYKVVDFTVKSDALRYYDISAVYRNYIYGIDPEPDDGTSIKEISYSVGQLWTAASVLGDVSYSRSDFETIEITEKFVGHVRYEGGFELLQNRSCDSHFVAFSTDKYIDKLFEAQVYFVRQSHKRETTLLGTDDKYGEKIADNVILSYTDKVSFSPSGIGQNKYTWNRIRTGSEYAEKENLSEDAKNKIKSKDYVLCFYESDYIYKQRPPIELSITETIVSDVTILRLKFETDGIMYNLGVVDNKQTGSRDPVNPQGIGLWEMIKDFFKTIGNWFADNWHWVVIVIVGVVLLILCIMFAPTIFLCLKVLLKAFAWLFKGLWWLICLPFKGIAALVNKIKERKAEKAA